MSDPSANGHGPASFPLPGLRDLDSHLIIADNVVVKALTLDGASGAVEVRLPALLHEFAIGVAGAPPEMIAKVLFIGSPEIMRKYGRLARDSANGAANAAERAA